MDATALFLEATRDNAQLREGLSLVMRHTNGRVWLIGGFVYRSIVHAAYGSAPPAVDLDVLIEAPAARIDPPEGWQLAQNRFGNPKLVGSAYSIDLVPLCKVHSIVTRGITPSIDAYLSGVPLTVQSIAYDVASRRIIGAVGIDAIERKVVAVNDPAFAAYAAQKKGTCVDEMVRKKAASLGFTPVLPMKA